MNTRHTRRMLRVSIGAASAALLAGLLAACNGSGSGTASAPPQPAPPVPSIALLAGDIGALGNLDGPGPLARLNAPGAMAFDAADNLYIADVDNHLIRKLTPQGNLSTVAGNRHSPGSADGAAATSGLANPTGVAVDRAGNVFVLDFGNGTIRKITPAGVVSTLAGTAGQLGNADGAGPAARFGRCTNTEGVDWCPVLPALAIDGAGNLYAADPGNHTVRKITPDGVVSTVAGVAGEAAYIDGPPGVARLHWPTGLAVDASGKIYVTDGNGIRMIAADGSITTIAGAEEPNAHVHLDGPGPDARFDTPTAIRVDAAGNLIVAEAGGGWVRKITPGGTVSTIAGTGYTSHPERTLYKAGGIAIDSNGVIFVSDSGNHVIRKLAADGSMPVLAGALSNRWPQDSGIDDAYIPSILGLTTDKTGAAYVLADYALYAQELLKITQDGAYSALPYMPNHLNYKLAIDNSGIMWLTSNSGVYRMSPDGTVSELDPPPLPRKRREYRWADRGWRWKCVCFHLAWNQQVQSGRTRDVGREVSAGRPRCSQGRCRQLVYRPRLQQPERHTRHSRAGSAYQHQLLHHQGNTDRLHDAGGWQPAASQVHPAPAHGARPGHRQPVHRGKHA